MIGMYYFRAGLFTCVARHVREQLDEMAQWGADFICLAVTESDLSYNAWNLEFLIEEIHKRGMAVYFVPSRVAGITAGAPLEADGLGYRYPHVWAMNRDGTPVVRRPLGVLCSFYYPEVEEHFVDVVGRMITQFPVEGIIWDEPKSTNWQDFSPLALSGNPNGDDRVYLQDFAAFMGRVNQKLKQKRNQHLSIFHFDEACRRDAVPEICAGIPAMDAFGVDGRPWRVDETGPARNECPQKVLFNYGERYLEAARSHGCQSLVLVENQRLSPQQVADFEAHLEGIVALDADIRLLYYYAHYGEATEKNMSVTQRLMKMWNRSQPSCSLTSSGFRRRPINH